jgi:hypothetical protein
MGETEDEDMDSGRCLPATPYESSKLELGLIAHPRVTMLRFATNATDVRIGA